MTSAALNTDYVLRTKTFSQHEAERLSADLLGMNSRYSEIKPRLPLGGPDGGRDIEAILDGRQLIWAAAGFRNMVDDGTEDKNWARTKFKADVDRMMKAKPDLTAMAFFTNVAQTPGELNELSAFAATKGITFVDLFSRERIRGELDSIRGLMFRVRYLQIPMTIEEQNAFFEHFGNKLEEAIGKRFEGLEGQLHRVQFELDAQKPLRYLRLVLVLQRPYTADELRRFRFLAEIVPLSGYGQHPKLWLGATDQYEGQGENGNVSMRNVVWASCPEVLLERSLGHDLGRESAQLFAHIDVQGRDP
jgi:hypothetical protein